MKTPYFYYLHLRNLSQCHIWSDVHNAVEMLKLWIMTSEPDKRGKNLSVQGVYIHTVVYILIILHRHRNAHITKRNYNPYVPTCPLSIM